MPESDTSSMQRNSKYEWVLCSENWQDFVIIHVTQLNVTPIEDNYANLSIKNQKYTFSAKSLQEIVPEKTKIDQVLLKWTSIGSFF